MRVSEEFHWVACFSPVSGELVTKSVTNRRAGNARGSNSGPGTTGAGNVNLSWPQ